MKSIKVNPPRHIEELNILLIENSNINLKVFEETFGDMVNSLSFATNYLEAVRLLSVMQYDMIFINLDEPEIGGTDTVEIIYNMIDKQEIKAPIFGLAGSMTKSEGTDCDELEDVMSFPIVPNALMGKALSYSAFDVLG